MSIAETHFFRKTLSGHFLFRPEQAFIQILQLPGGDYCTVYGWWNWDHWFMEVYSSMPVGEGKTRSDIVKRGRESFKSLAVGPKKVFGVELKQTSTARSGYFALAYAAALADGQMVEYCKFNISKMEEHLSKCLNERKLSPFPKLA